MWLILRRGKLPWVRQIEFKFYWFFIDCIVTTSIINTLILSLSIHVPVEQFLNQSSVGVLIFNNLFLVVEIKPVISIKYNSN